MTRKRQKPDTNGNKMWEVTKNNGLGKLCSGGKQKGETGWNTVVVVRRTHKQQNIMKQIYSRCTPRPKPTQTETVPTSVAVGSNETVCWSNALDMYSTNTKQLAHILQYKNFLDGSYMKNRKRNKKKPQRLQSDRKLLD